MDLPPEIRRIILIELLWYQHPLEYDDKTRHPADWHMSFGSKKGAKRSPPANGQLHLRILQTCKRLYSEGSGILYDDTINCRLGQPRSRSDGGHDGVFILRHQYYGEIARVPRAIREKISRVRVQLFAHHQRGRRHSSRIEMEEGVKELALAFRKAPAWKTIAIEVFHIYHQSNVERQSRDPADSIKFAWALYPLRYARNRSAVTISGLSSRLISDLPALMTSTKPFVDLTLAYEALKEYVDTVKAGARGQHQWRLLGSLANRSVLCRRAVRHEEVEVFIRVRKSIMVFLSRMIVEQEANVFRHDPDAWDHTPGLSVLAPDEEIRSPPEEEDEPLSDYEANEVIDEDTDAYDDTDSSDDSGNFDEDEEDEDDSDYLNTSHDYDDALCNCGYCRGEYPLPP